MSTTAQILQQQPVFAKPAAGRPTIYSQTLAERICERIANGETSSSISRDPAMPDRETVRRWRIDNPHFADMFARARELSALSLEEKALDRLEEATDKDQSLVARNLLEGIKWATAKRDPDTYGEKITQDVRFSGTVTVEHVTDRAQLLLQLQRKLGIDATAPPQIEGVAFAGEPDGPSEPSEEG